MKAMYRNYPASLEDFEDWRKEANEIMNYAHKRLSRK